MTDQTNDPILNSILELRLNYNHFPNTYIYQNILRDIISPISTQFTNLVFQNTSFFNEYNVDIDDIDELTTITFEYIAQCDIHFIDTIYNQIKTITNQLQLTNQPTKYLN